MTNTPEVPKEPLVLQQESDDAALAHDALFYKTFSNPEHAAAELKHILDPTLVARIDWDTLRPLSIKFVDAKLKGKYADVLYSVRLGGRETLIHFLLEHKSESDTWTLLQLLEYKARIWRNYIEDPVNKWKTRLPVIIAVVLHHSARGWTGAVRFRQLFDVADEDVGLLAPYMLDFGIMMDDISKMSGEALAQRPITPEGRLVLFALRFGRTPAKFMTELPKIVPVLLTVRSRPHGALVIAGFIVYLKTVGKVREEEVRMALQEAVGNSIAEEILFGAERRYEKGVHDAELRGERTGELRGELQGELKGQRKVLKRQFGQRFGVLPPEVIARIDTASAEALDAMDLRVLTAATLEEALGSLAPTRS
jgi:hypothetical protein